MFLNIKYLFIMILLAFQMKLFRKKLKTTNILLLKTVNKLKKFKRYNQLMFCF